MATITIETSEGTITIGATFTEYTKRALDILEQINELKKDLKEEVEAAAEESGMKPAKVNKYFNARFKEQTKEAKALGDLFGAIDEAVSV